MVRFDNDIKNKIIITFDENEPAKIRNEVNRTIDLLYQRLKRLKWLK